MNESQNKFINETSFLRQIKNAINRFTRLNNNEQNDPTKESLEYYHNLQDAIDNKATTPPPDEEIRMPSIWVFEVYPPTHIDNLKLGAERLGWIKENSTNINSDFTDQIDELRSRSSGGGWLNLGYIVNSTKKTWGMNRQAPMPAQIESIRASIFQPIPSITILICQFILDKSIASSLEEPLRSEFKTFCTKTETGFMFNDVEHQKQVATSLMREYLRSLCTSWVTEHFHGYFSSDHSISEHPTCELITFKKHQPYEKVTDIDRYSYLRMLKLDYNDHAWQADDLKGLFFQVSEDSGKKWNRAIISGRLDDVMTDTNMEHYGGDKESQLINWLRYLDHTLGTWVLYVFSVTIEKQLNIARDEYAAVNINNTVSAAQRLANLDARILDMQRNAVPFANDLIAYCAEEHYFMHNVYDFKPANDNNRCKPLFEFLRDHMLNQAKYFIQAEIQIRAIADRSSSIISAITNDKLASTNVKLQQGIYRMTLVLVILTIVLAYPELEKYEIDRKLLDSAISYIKLHLTY